MLVKTVDTPIATVRVLFADREIWMAPYRFGTWRTAKEQRAYLTAFVRAD